MESYVEGMTTEVNNKYLSVSLRERVDKIEGVLKLRQSQSCGDRKKPWRVLYACVIGTHEYIALLTGYLPKLELRFHRAHYTTLV